MFLGHEAKSIPGYPYENGSTVVDMWYGIDPGPYGQRSRGLSVGTGPASGSEAPVLWIYNPADLLKGKPFNVEPAAEVLFNTLAQSCRVRSTPRISSAVRCSMLKQTPGTVTMAMFDQTVQFDPKPVVLKFSVTP